MLQRSGEEGENLETRISPGQLGGESDDGERRIFLRSRNHSCHFSFYLTSFFNFLWEKLAELPQQIALGDSRIGPGRALQGRKPRER